jgi:hypothetical protein
VKIYLSKLLISELEITPTWLLEPWKVKTVSGQLSTKTAELAKNASFPAQARRDFLFLGSAKSGISARIQLVLDGALNRCYFESC